MKSITDAEKKLYDEQFNMRDILLTFDEGFAVDSSMIASESMTFEEMISEENSLKFGSCNASSFGIEIKDTEHEYKGKRFKAEMITEGIRRTIGYFAVANDNKTDDKLRRKITAYDAIYSVKDRDVSSWYLGLTFPMTLKAFRDSFFKYLGITQTTTTLVNDSMTVEKTVEPSTMKALTVMEAICEVNACFGHVNSDGKFEYINLFNKVGKVFPQATLYPGTDFYPDGSANEIDYKLSSLKYEDYKCKQITEVKIRQEENDVGCTVGKTGNTYVIQGNFLCYGKGSEELTVIAENFLLMALYYEFTPASAVAKGKPYLELGDFVEATALNGDRVIFPILHRTMSGIIALIDTYEAKGTEVFSEQKGSIQDQIEQIKGKSNVLSRTIEETQSKITNIENGLETKITQTAESIKSEASKTYTTKTEAADAYNSIRKDAQGYADKAENNAKTNTDGKLKSYSTTVQMNSAIEQSADEVKTEINKVEETVSGFENIYPGSDVFPSGELYSKNGAVSNSEMNTFVDVKVDSVTLEVTKKAYEYAETAEKNANGYLDDKLKYYNTAEEVSAKINASADGITQEYSSKIAETRKYVDDSSSAAVKSANDSMNAKLAEYYTKTDVDASIKTTKDGIEADYNKKIDHLGCLYPSNTIFPGNDLYPENGYAATSEVSTRIALSEEGIKSHVEQSIESERENIDSYYSDFIQKANRMDWLVAGGESESDMVLTDRFIALLSEEIDISGKVTFSTFDSDLKNKINTIDSNATNAQSSADAISDNIYTTGKTTIDGGKITADSITTDQIASRTITADLLATDAIKSQNYEQAVSGAFLNLKDGSFDSKYTKWDNTGKFETVSGKFTNAEITNATIKGGKLDIETSDKTYDQIMLTWLNQDGSISASTKINPGQITVKGEGALNQSVGIEGNRIVIANDDTGNSAVYASDGVSVGTVGIGTEKILISNGGNGGASLSCDALVISDGSSSMSYADGTLWASNIQAGNGWTGNAWFQDSSGRRTTIYIENGIVTNVTTG